MFYLTHQAVKKVKHGKTKWMIVFDASSQETSIPYHNDVLEMAPNLLPEIIKILLWFTIGDITQAFLLLALNKRDRDLTRLFWFKIMQDSGGYYRMTDEIKTYRFIRLPFGLTCISFLLSETLGGTCWWTQSHIPHGCAIIENNTFMDNFAIGVENDNGTIAIYYGLHWWNWLTFLYQRTYTSSRHELKQRK